jgi:hypothetical protein
VQPVPHCFRRGEGNTWQNQKEGKKKEKETQKIHPYARADFVFAEMGEGKKKKKEITMIGPIVQKLNFDALFMV